MTERPPVSDVSLQGRSILLVEDEYFIADAMRRGLEASGARVIGPAASVEDALDLLAAETVDGAVLDVNLDDESVFPVAQALTAKRVPFLFATGYGASDLPPEWRHVPRHEKPVDAATIARALLGDDAR